MTICRTLKRNKRKILNGTLENNIDTVKVDHEIKSAYGKIVGGNEDLSLITIIKSHKVRFIVKNSYNKIYCSIRIIFTFTQFISIKVHY